MSGSEDKRISVSILPGGFPGALTIAFVVLKLCNVISWSWWWVMSPIIIRVVFSILLFVLCAIAVCVSDDPLLRYRK